MLATEKQIDFIVRLASERGIAHTETALAGWSKTQASEEITKLLAMPKTNALVEGIYFKDGVVYKVQISGAGRAYAKVLKEHGFSYDPTAIKALSPQDKITIAQAKAYGIQYGVCCVCGRTLTDSTSVAEGIGPVCGQRI